MLFNVAYSVSYYRAITTICYYNCIILEDLVTAIGDHILLQSEKTTLLLIFHFLSDNFSIHHFIDGYLQNFNLAFPICQRSCSLQHAGWQFAELLLLPIYIVFQRLLVSRS